jgi:hypothetical protein
MSLIDLVRQNLGPNEIQQISQQLGVDNATAQRAVESALPTMVAGMAGQSQNPAGASAIQSLMGTHGGVLGSLGSILSAGGAGDGGGILGQIFGQHQDTVHQEVQQKSRLDPEKAKRLLMILAPIVLGALAHKREQNQAAGTTQPGINDTLRNEAQNAQRQSPGSGGLVGNILSHVETPRA